MIHELKSMASRDFGHLAQNLLPMRRTRMIVDTERSETKVVRLL